MERIIVVNRENYESEIPVTQENAERDIELFQENAEQEIPLVKERVVIIYNPLTTDHSRLQKLDYEHAGHTGFQEEMNALTNVEIERMWNSV